MTFPHRWLAPLLALSLAGCSGSDATPDLSTPPTAVEDAASPPDGTDPAFADAAPDASLDGGPLADASKGDPAPTDAGVLDCVTTFGNALTAGFGRIDGTLVAVVPPGERRCGPPNSDHVIVQVRMNGAVYRMVVNVQSDRAGQDPRVRLKILDLALPAPAFAEGWHTSVNFDYPTLGLRSTAFEPFTMAELSAKMQTELRPGEPVSVYAVSGNGRPESAHLIHRNSGTRDGAIVVAPASASPKVLAFAFASQTF